MSWFIDRKVVQKLEGKKESSTHNSKLWGGDGAVKSSPFFVFFDFVFFDFFVLDFFVFFLPLLSESPLTAIANRSDATRNLAKNCICKKSQRVKEQNIILERWTLEASSARMPVALQRRDRNTYNHGVPQKGKPLTIFWAYGRSRQLPRFLYFGQTTKIGMLTENYIKKSILRYIYLGSVFFLEAKGSSDFFPNFFLDLQLSIW